MLTVYLSIAIVSMFLDAVACLFAERRYNILASAVGAALWPILLPLFIILAAVATRNLPKVSVKDTLNDLAGE